jgi:hypothetical protein
MPESRMSDYDTDILIWSERQGELLRRVAGEPVNDAEADWPNIAEGIMEVGRSDCGPADRCCARRYGTC